MSSPILARVLSNIYLPPVEGFSMHHFGDYFPPEQVKPRWLAEMERRSLASILPLIPTSEFPDILVIASPEYLPIPVDVHTFPGLKILLITDWNVCLRFLPALCPLFDYCFTDWPGYRLLKRSGVANIHHQALFGYDPNVFKIQNINRNLDVSFCGNLNASLHGERNRLLARLAVWGKNTSRLIHLKQAFAEAYVEILNRSCIVFNYSIRSEANMRLFESMAMGAVALVEEDNQEVAILFQEGKHYFKYAPGRIEERLNALLASPEKLAEVSLAAKEAVKRHTKSIQLQTLLEMVCKNAPSILPSNIQKNLKTPTRAQGEKALIKLRILGAGFSTKESMEELEFHSRTHQGLEQETLVATLLTLLEKNQGESLPAVETLLEHFLNTPILPALLREFMSMKFAVLRSDWTKTLDFAEKCRAILATLNSESTELNPFYAYFYSPLDLGKGVNSDLNQIFRHHLTTGGHEAYLEWMKAHCDADMGKAYLSLGSPADALRHLVNIPLGKFSSLNLFDTLLSALLGIGDKENIRRIAKDYFSLQPLDTALWDKIFNAYTAIGEKPEKISFLNEISILAETFLTPEQAAYVNTLLAQELT